MMHVGQDLVGSAVGYGRSGWIARVAADMTAAVSDAMSTTAVRTISATCEARMSLSRLQRKPKIRSRQLLAEMKGPMTAPILQVCHKADEHLRIFHALRSPGHQ